MRHKSNKKMYRVHFTNNWFIDVTEDHSLIGYESTKFNQSIEKRKDVLKRLIEIKPKELGKKASSVVTLQKIPNSHEKIINILKRFMNLWDILLVMEVSCQTKQVKTIILDYL